MMSNFGYFNGGSAFAQEARVRTPEEATAALEAYADLVNGRKTAAVKESKAPLEHWWHDLGTLETLLEERHPDVRRAMDLIQEIRREMERWVR